MVDLERLIPTVFRKDEAGNTLFYPWGVLGAGVIIEADEKAKQVRGFVRNYCVIGLAAIAGAQFLFGFAYVLYAFFAWSLGYVLIIRALLYDLPRTAEKLIYSDVLGEGTDDPGLAKLVMLALVSIGLAAGGLWILVDGKDDRVGWAGFGFFGFCAVVLGCMIYRKLKKTP